MFKFLKEKIKGVISKFTKSVEKEVDEVPKEYEDKKIKKDLDEKEVKKEEKVEVEESKEIIKKKFEEDKEQKKVKNEEIKIKSKKEKQKSKEKKEDLVKKIKEEDKIKKKEVKEEFIKEKIKEEFKSEEIKEFSNKIIEEKQKFTQPIEVEEAVIKDLKEKNVEIPIEETEKKGFFRRITEAFTTKKISIEKFNELFWDLELVLLENNVAVEVIEKIKQNLSQEIVDKPLPRGKIEETVVDILKKSVDEILTLDERDLIFEIKSKSEKPYVICFFGVNGSGKTTTIAKLANLLKNKGFKVVLAAGDTFRAAAIDQLTYHAESIGVKIIKYDYGADAAAVAFDAVKFGKEKKQDIVLIDTAGRQHSDHNLMDEMKKIIRVAKPDLKIFIGESITGNDCIEQARKFNEAVGIDGIILSKADIDEKGGAALSVSYVTKKPILFFGIGQNYVDLKEFNKQEVIKNLGL